MTSAPSAQKVVLQLVRKRCLHDRTFKRNECAVCLRDGLEAYASARAIDVTAMVGEIAVHPRGRKSDEYHEGFDAAITAVIGSYAKAVADAKP